MSGTRYTRLLCSAAVIALASGTAAYADDANFNIQPQALNTALNAFSEQSAHPVLFKSDMAVEKLSPGVSGPADPEIALAQLLQGTGLSFRRAGDTFVIVQGGSDDPQSRGAAGDGATVEALIVTAQKREEDIQDVPIAISAFSQEELTTHQIAGGPDLMTQIPNFTFTKTNFTSFSIQIRGIGTQAISATVDPAVAVAFNNTPFITNRFFEQEFFDLQRVEVLRGPQGTLYGRNATAGVVNIISQKPKFFYESKLSADVGNYSSHRLEGMLNIPLAEDRIAFRLAGAWTKRDGYVTNTLKGQQTDGRDLWSARASLRFTPTDRLDVNLIYEHFEEDDDRLRSGKQLCTKHEFPEVLAPIIDPGGGAFGDGTYFSQGCQMGSLYDAEAYQVPNGFALPFYGPLANLNLPINSAIDPYASTVQSQDKRVIETHLEPIYQAKSDIIHLAIEYDLTAGLTLSSETAYAVDEIFSFNDYNRFNTNPGIFLPNEGYSRDLTFIDVGVLDENGVFCDPQLGCSDRLVAADVSTAVSDQFSQEFRLSSDFDGPFNFHLGANYLHYDTVNKYYVFINTLSLWAATWCGLSLANPYDPTDTDETCRMMRAPAHPTSPTVGAGFTGVYMDHNPIGSLNDYGRNYFLSKNPFGLVSYAVFGEAQYELTPDLKITAGLRYTVDEKKAPIIPTWLLVSDTYGQPTKEIVSQEWREPTGRLVVDWKPVTGFTDETLVYASYAHGYKAGGTNPPLPGALPFQASSGELDEDITFITSNQPKVFGPEFVDAFEIGTKNTLLDGRMTFNLGAFYYDYEGYQISQIVNRSAVNWNVDAEVWGAELEVDWRPFENLKIGFRGGYEKTKVGKGQSLVDMIDRTAGDPDWFVLKPFPTIPSNCIAPVDLFLQFGRFMHCAAYYRPDIDPLTDLPYVPNPTVRRVQFGSDNPATAPLGSQYAGYPGFRPGDVPGGGAGIAKDISGNELPNAPDFTTTVTVDYTIPLRGEWLLTLHGDFYRQSEAWTRIYNEDPYDRLEPFSQINLAAIFTNDAAGWTVMAYLKNALDQDNITGAFLNSDDSGLTTNIFLNEPRLYGLRVTKEWTGSLLGAFADSRGGGSPGPYPFEVSAGITRLTLDAPNKTYTPFWASDWNDTLFRLPLEVQGDELDTGDERDVRVAYRPVGSPWSVSAGARFGRTNGTASVDETIGQTQIPVFTPPLVEIVGYQKYQIARPAPFSSVSGENREEFMLVDFAVGRDVGMGLMGDGGRSAISAGVRYGEFESSTEVEMYGLPYRTDPTYALGGTHTGALVEAEFASSRKFEGAGPQVSWDAATRLFGGDQTGRLLLDWSAGGGVLFGTQETEVEHEATSRYYVWPARGLSSNAPGGGNPQSEEPPVSATHSRSEDVDVPFFGATLGLSYELQRVKVSTGYRWERYYDVLDGGVDEAQGVDRTIEGPYLRFTVGFGG